MITQGHLGDDAREPIVISAATHVSQRDGVLWMTKVTSTRAWMSGSKIKYE